MDPSAIPAFRLQSQHIKQADFTSAEKVVSWMGAMQAQDYAGALWSIALRTPDLTKADVEQAIIDRKIVRTWPMRGTLHFIAAKDARWMVQLLAPRATAAAASRRRALELTDAVLEKSKRLLETALTGEVALSRQTLCDLLDTHGIATAGQRGIHILRYFSEQGMLCFGPHEGKQPTFVLMDEWLSRTPEKSREEALFELTRRYFTSHGPATLQDFAGWANITLTDARRGLMLVGDTLQQTELNQKIYWHSPNFNVSQRPSLFLLPGFDEYILGYKDRSAVLASEYVNRIIPGGNGVFQATIVSNGQVIGIWKRATKAKSTRIHLEPFSALSETEKKATVQQAKRYEMFLQSPVEITYAK